MAKRQARRRTSRQRPSVGKTNATAEAAVLVSAWEDDPGDPAVQPPPIPISLPAPNLAAEPLPCRISGVNPPPKIHQPGTTEFRFFAAATALRRTSDFWGEMAGSPLQ